MPPESNLHAAKVHSAYGKWEKSHSGARRSLAGGADALWGTLSVACETESSACTQHALGLSMALSMHSACTQHGTQHAFSMQSDQHTCETETQRPGLHRCTRGEYCRSGCSCIVLRLAGSTSPVDMRFIQPPSRISCAA